jgi:hypothetical protein
LSLTINAKTYNADAFGSNSVGYIGPAKTQSVRDDLTLRRIAAKPTKDFSGVSRYISKVVRTHTLTGAINPTWESISNFEVSIPVGASGADIDLICDDHASMIGSANFKTFLKTQKINF